MRLASVSAPSQHAETTGTVCGRTSTRRPTGLPVEAAGRRYAAQVAPPRPRRGLAGAPRLRSTGPRFAGLLVVAAVALSSCGSATGEATAPPVTEDPTTTTTTTVERRFLVPGPEAGTLRAHVPAVEPTPTDIEVLLFGDSVALLLADDLAAVLDEPLTVDAIDCRRLDAGFQGPCGGVPTGEVVASGLDDLRTAAAELQSPEDTVAVIVVANNAALAPEDLVDAMDALDGVPRVWWVTARVGGRAWQDPNNRLLGELAERDPRAGVIDWFAASEGTDSLADNVHPHDAGQAQLADLVADHVHCDCTP